MLVNVEEEKKTPNILVKFAENAHDADVGGWTTMTHNVRQSEDVSWKFFLSRTNEQREHREQKKNSSDKPQIE